VHEGHKEMTFKNEMPVFVTLRVLRGYTAPSSAGCQLKSTMIDLKRSI
jgi:hypothetical protein